MSRRNNRWLGLRANTFCAHAASYDSALQAYRNLGRSQRDQWGERHLSFDGVSGTYASVSGSPAGSRDWTVIFRAQRPTADLNVVSKGALGEEWHVGVISTGVVSWRGNSGTGDAADRTSLNSTTAIIPASGFGWCKIVVTDNNGSQAEAKFYSSSDGVVWTLEDTINATAYTQYTATAGFYIGKISQSYADYDKPISHIRVYSDLTETTKVLDIQPSDMTSQGAFVCTTGQTVTLNGNARVETPGWLNEPATPPTRAVGSGYVATYWPSSNGISVPVTTSTTRLKFRVLFKLSVDTMTGTGYTFGDNSGWGHVYFTPAKTFVFNVYDASGVLQILYSPGGQDLSDWVWYEFEYEVGGNQTIRKSTDGVNWTTVASQAATHASIRAGTGATGFGGYSVSAGNSEFAYRRMQFFNDGSATPAVDLNPGAPGGLTQTSVANWAQRAHVEGGALVLPGVASNYLSIADAAWMNFAGSFKVRIEGEMEGRPSSTHHGPGRWGGAPKNQWYLRRDTNGKVTLRYSTNGSDEINLASPLAAPSGVIYGVEAEFVSGAEIRYSYKDGSGSWISLGSVSIGDQVASITGRHMQFDVSWGGVTDARLYSRLQIWDAGMQVLDLDASSLPDYATTIPNTGSAGGYAVVNYSTANDATINRATSGLKTFAATGETGGAWVFDGTDDHLYVPDHALLDNGTGDVSFGVIHRQHGSAFGVIIARTRTTEPGYQLTTTRAIYQDGTTQNITSQLSGPADGSLTLEAGVVDSSRVWKYVNTTTVSVTRTAGDGDSDKGLYIGSTIPAQASFYTGEIHGAFVARRALTADELKRRSAQAKIWGLAVSGV